MTLQERHSEIMSSQIMAQREQLEEIKQILISRSAIGAI